MLTPQMNTNNSSHRKTKMKSLICSVLLPERLTESLLYCPFGILCAGLLRSAIRRQFPPAFRVPESVTPSVAFRHLLLTSYSAFFILSYYITAFTICQYIFRLFCVFGEKIR